jgi:hypothetical protein
MAQNDDGEEKSLGWFDEMELSVVVTEGNSQTDSFGLENVLTRAREPSSFVLHPDGVKQGRRRVAMGGKPVGQEEPSETDVHGRSSSPASCPPQSNPLPALPRGPCRDDRRETRDRRPTRARHPCGE